MKIKSSLILLFVCVANTARAALAIMPSLPDTGLISYDVASVSGAATWCCFAMHEKQLSCDLDKNDQGFVSGQGASPSAAQNILRIFVRTEFGLVKSVRPVGLSCKVHASQPVRHLGLIQTGASLAWLHDHAHTKTLMDATVAAIAAHDDVKADAILSRLTAEHSGRNLRHQALFWAGKLRGTAGFDLAVRALQDASVKFRAHAVFVIAQTDDSRRVAKITQTGRLDQSSQVRSQAWFWLAKTDNTRAAEIAQAIRTAVLNDADEHVQEQALFALSQLPDKQASQALITLLDDRMVPKQSRERALFWLTQSEDPTAQRYLDRVLGQRQ